jgi:hypothetical protein
LEAASRFYICPDFRTNYIESECRSSDIASVSSVYLDVEAYTAGTVKSFRASLLCIVKLLVLGTNISFFFSIFQADETST